eukprot:11113409-Prorocentrum_lima.AAC.1
MKTKPTTVDRSERRMPQSLPSEKASEGKERTPDQLPTNQPEGHPAEWRIGGQKSGSQHGCASCRLD